MISFCLSCFLKLHSRQHTRIFKPRNAFAKWLLRSSLLLIPLPAVVVGGCRNAGGVSTGSSRTGLGPEIPTQVRVLWCKMGKTEKTVRESAQMREFHDWLQWEKSQNDRPFPHPYLYLYTLDTASGRYNDIFLKISFYCCSITVVCIYSPPLPSSTPVITTSLFCFHHPLGFCPCVLYTCSWKPFSPLSLPTSTLVIVILFLISMSLVMFFLLVCFVD